MIDKQEIINEISEGYKIKQQEHLNKVSKAIDWVMDNLVTPEYRQGITGNPVIYNNVKCMITRHDFRYGAEIDIRPLMASEKVAEYAGQKLTIEF